MNALLRIRQRYQGLAQSDKKLADYLLLQPDTVICCYNLIRRAI